MFESLEQLQVGKKIITLIGKLETPIIISKPYMKMNDCWIKIVKGLQDDKKPVYSPVGKLVKGQIKAPNVLNGFRGYLKITSVDYSEKRLRKRIERFIGRRFFGQFTNEGFGRVKWLTTSLCDFKANYFTPKKKFKTRKGLGCNYPKPLQRLLIALMLHDFVKTEKHPSKIYEQIAIADEEIREACLNHHNGKANSNQLVPLIKRYDAIASFITRKKAFQTNSRYDKMNGEIDFKDLAREIEERSDSAYKLYRFIYNSSTLTRIVEAMDYQKSSLRTHLLLMVNKAINDYYMGILKILNDKLIIKKFSESTTKKDEPSSVNDAEKHQFPLMSNADSENTTSSMTEKAGNIEREETIKRKLKK